MIFSGKIFAFKILQNMRGKFMFPLQVKNFKCAECGYSCYLKTDLERHINNVHDKFRSPCPVCGKKYSDLRQHVRIVHEGAKVSKRQTMLSK